MTHPRGTHVSIVLDQHNIGNLTPQADGPTTFSRRFYMIFSVMERTGCDHWAAIEAVSSTAIEHPEWDMDEEKTWDQWEAVT